MAALGERGAGNDARRVEAMVARHGPALLRVANQFSLCHDDALDAYQRALEIYLRRLATVDLATEGAWMRVVVKHEAMAIRAARQSSVDSDDVDLDQRVGGLREVEDTVAGGERVDRSVEALKALKPDEAVALLLKAEGLSYDEIGRRFGWSYTKVNRSIAEGRKRFLKEFRGIEAGEACERYEPVLDALAGGTATSAQMLSIRPHLRHCATCRATVRGMRFSRTRRIALLAPFAWLSKLMARADVMQYASSGGGGRLGPAAAALGLCVGSVGAGACVMTGALPAPPIVAQLESHREAAPKPVEAVVTKKVVKPKRAKPTPTPTVAPTVIAAATRTPVAKTQTVKAVRKTVVKKKRKAKVSSGGDFSGFEGQAASAPTQTRSVATASTAGTGGGGSSSTVRSGGGGGGGGKAAGGEFGIEGG